MSQQTPLDLLTAINELLSSIGQAPVTSIDVQSNIYEYNPDTQQYTQLTIPTNPDVAMAQQTLLEESRRVQSEGWSFNKEYNYPITPNATTREITYADNQLQIDLCRSADASYGSLDTVRRQSKLYERNNHTFIWNQSVVYCDIVWYFDWEDIPRPIQDFVIKKASAVLSQRVVGDPQLYAALLQQAQECRAYALEYDCNQGDYTYFGHPQGQDYYRSYQPYHTLYR